MKNLYASFPGRANAPDGNYPSGSAKNVVTQGDGTGTPWTAVIANDLYGFFQRCLALAGITASNNSETAVASDVHNAIRLSKGLPGELIWHCWSTIPTGVRVLNLEGQTIDITTTYAALAASVYIGNSNNDDLNANGFFKTSDPGGTTRSTSGTYMVLPDGRGRFLRTIDPTQLIDIDPAGGVRFSGSEQNWAITNHHHGIGGAPEDPIKGIGFTDPATGVITGGSEKVIYEKAAGNPDVIIYATESIDNADNPNVFAYHKSDNEIRPVNMAANLGIWY